MHSPAADECMCWLGPPGSRIVHSEGGRRVRVLDLGPPARSKVIDTDFPQGRDIAGSPDGKWVAAGTWEGTGGLRIYDADSGRVVKEWQAGLVVPQFSPDGRWLAVATGSMGPDGAACSLWRVGTWECVHTWPTERTSSPSRMAFSPDGRVLAIQPTMTDVELVDTTTFRELARLQAPNPLLLTLMAFSPDGGQLASATGRGVVQLWDVRGLRKSLSEMGLDWDLSE
jgi:WD40 repeat protein